MSRGSGNVSLNSSRKFEGFSVLTATGVVGRPLRTQKVSRTFICFVFVFLLFLSGCVFFLVYGAVGTI
jgi:hypothetical protein